MKLLYLAFCAAIVFYISGCANRTIASSSQTGKSQSSISTPLTKAELITSQSVRPKLIRAYPPQYPTEAKKKGLTGTVVLTIIIDEEGSVSNAEIKSTTDPIFNEAALNAVKRYKWEPAEKDGEPVSLIIDIPLSFMLE